MLPCRLSSAIKCHLPSTYGVASFHLLRETHRPALSGTHTQETVKQHVTQTSSLSPTTLHGIYCLPQVTVLSHCYGSMLVKRNEQSSLSFVPLFDIYHTGSFIDPIQYFGDGAACAMLGDGRPPGAFSTQPVRGLAAMCVLRPVFLGSGSALEELFILRSDS